MQYPQKRKKWALVLLAAAQFLLVLDVSIANVALPAIDRHFHVGSESTLSWVVNGCLLTFGGLLLLGGRLGDRWGHSRMFVAGMVLYGAASLLAAFAPGFGVLVAGRMLQGVGSALVAPAALGLVAVIFAEGAERNRAMGTWGAVSGSAGGAGLLLGGLLTSQLGWEWVFLINVPVVLVALAAARRLLPASTGGGSTGSFDLAGAVAAVVGVSGLIYGFVEAGNTGWGSAGTIVPLALGTVVLALFVVIELRVAHPLIPFSLFRSRSLTGANLVSLTFGMASLAVLFYLVLYLQQVKGFDALKAGSLSLPMNVVIVVIATMSAKWVTRIGPRPVLMAGLALFAVAMIWFHFITADGSYLTQVLGPLILIGLGFALAFVGMTVAAVSGVGSQDAGVASGLINTTQQVGSAIGLAVLAAVSNSSTAHALNRGVPQLQALTQGFRLAILVGAGFAFLALLLAYVILSKKDNDAFVRMVADAGGPMRQESAQALAEVDGAAAVAGLAGEHDLEVTRKSHG